MNTTMLAIMIGISQRLGRLPPARGAIFGVETGGGDCARTSWDAAMPLAIALPPLDDGPSCEEATGGSERAGISIGSAGAYRRSSAGDGTLNALAIAIVMAEALEKRASGSLAILRRMTADRAGDTWGLMEVGGVGMAL